METQPGTYHIENIFLLDIVFHREILIDFDNQENLLQNTIDFATEYSEEASKEKFGVTVNFTLKGIQAQKEVYSCFVKMAGVFIKEGEPAVNELSFKKINAPAIIFPFIREQVATTILKSGCGVVLVPPVNFHAISKNNQ